MSEPKGTCEACSFPARYCRCRMDHEMAGLRVANEKLEATVADMGESMKMKLGEMKQQWDRIAEVEVELHQVKLSTTKTIAELNMRLMMVGEGFPS